jgi:hypothetical protein
MSAKLRNSGKNKRIIKQCCGSGMFTPIADPDFIQPGSRISDPDPTTETKEEGGIKCCLTFFMAKNLTKCKTILFLNRSRKKT